LEQYQYSTNIGYILLFIKETGKKLQIVFGFHRALAATVKPRHMNLENSLNNLLDIMMIKGCATTAKQPIQNNLISGFVVYGIIKPPWDNGYMSEHLIIASDLTEDFISVSFSLSSEIDTSIPVMFTLVSFLPAFMKLSLHKADEEIAPIISKIIPA
jgi:hypothetical protein